MPTKLVMRWDIKPESESEYFEFLVHEFIPGLNKLGIVEIQVWYTTYGDCEQKLASGIAPSLEKMNKVLNSAEWKHMVNKLRDYVDNFSQKIIPATGGFQV